MATLKTNIGNVPVRIDADDSVDRITFQMLAMYFRNRRPAESNAILYGDNPGARFLRREMSGENSRAAQALREQEAERIAQENADADIAAILRLMTGEW